MPIKWLLEWCQAPEAATDGSALRLRRLRGGYRWVCPEAKASERRLQMGLP